MAYLVPTPGIPVGGRSGSSRHVEALARALTALGHRVTLFGAPPNSEPPFASTRDDVAAPRPFTRPAGSPIPGEGAIVPAETQPAGHLKVHLVVERGAPARRFPGRAVTEIYRSLCTADRIAAWLRYDPPDLLIERHELFSLAGAAVAHRLKRPLLLEVNAPRRLERARFEGFSAPVWGTVAERLAYRTADHVMVVSDPLRDHVCRRAGVPGDRVSVVGNGTDLDHFFPRSPNLELRQRLGLDDGLVVGHYGSLKPWHAPSLWVDVFARAWRRRPHLRGIVVGDGPERRRMLQRAADLGVRDVIRFTGWIPFREVPAYLATMDVLLAPYPTLTPFYFTPLKILDALAMGIPVITSRQGDLPTLVGDAGCTVDPGDIAGMVAALVHAADDPAQRSRWRRSGPRRVAGMDWTDVAGRIVQCYEQVQRRHRGTQREGRHLAGPFPGWP